MSHDDHLDRLVVYLIKGETFTMTMSVRVKNPPSPNMLMKALPVNAYAFQIKECSMVVRRSLCFWSTYYTDGRKTRVLLK